jgi:hypothetical protein
MAYNVEYLHALQSWAAANGAEAGDASGGTPPLSPQQQPHPQQHMSPPGSYHGHGGAVHVGSS